MAGHRKLCAEFWQPEPITGTIQCCSGYDWQGCFCVGVGWERRLMPVQGLCITCSATMASLCVTQQTRARHFLTLRLTLKWQKCNEEGRGVRVERGRERPQWSTDPLLNSDIRVGQMRMKGGKLLWTPWLWFFMVKLLRKLYSVMPHISNEGDSKQHIQ